MTGEKTWKQIKQNKKAKIKTMLIVCFKTPQGIETNPYIMGTTSTFILLPLRKILFSISKLNRRKK